MTLAELFSDPARWCQGASARDKSGKSVWIDSEYAVSWCLAGGIRKCYDIFSVSHPYEERREFDRKIDDYLEADSWIEWNDAPERTIEEIQEIARVIDGWIRDIQEERKV